MEKLKEEHEKIRLKKEKLQLKEKLLKEKEKQQRARQFVEIGRLAYKANIDEMDQDSLFSAFLEIAEMSKDQKKIDSWKKKSMSYNEMEQNEKKARLSISFKNDPPKEIKEMLKKLSFKWNNFRSEYYGYGEKNVISDQLKNYQVNIEIVE